MPTAQDHAFIQLASQRGFLDPHGLIEAQQLLGHLGSDDHVAPLLVKRGLLTPDQTARLLRTLVRGQFACKRCSIVLPYETLARMTALTCPRCRRELTTQVEAPQDPNPLVNSVNSGAYPAISGPSGAYPAVSGPSGAYPALGPSSGSYPAAPGGRPPSSSGSLPALQGAWDGEDTLLDRKPKRTRRSEPMNDSTVRGVSLIDLPGGGFDPNEVTIKSDQVLRPPRPPEVHRQQDDEGTLLERERRNPGPSGAYKASGALSEALPGASGPQPGYRPSTDEVPSGGMDEERTVKDKRVINVPKGPDGRRRLGDYVLLSELGRGANGVIYLARRQGLERRFALKVMISDRLEDEAAIQRFNREAGLASKIQDPGIISVFHKGQEGRHFYYVMEYCPGRTLEQRLSDGKLEPDEAARIVAQMARSVQAAHDLKVIHRDLKPANVILEHESGRPRITDFGVARDVNSGSGLTHTGELLGTPMYMAPEQLMGERDLDFRVDVYSLGVILYEALTGTQPYQATSAIQLAEQICTQDPPVAKQVEQRVPERLSEIARQAMAKDREERFPSAGRLADALEGWLSTYTPMSTTGLRIAAPRWVIGVALALGSVGVGVGVFFLVSLLVPAGDPAHAEHTEELQAGLETLRGRIAALHDTGVSERRAVLEELRGELELLKTEATSEALTQAVLAEFEALEAWTHMQRAAELSREREPLAPIRAELDKALEYTVTSPDLRDRVLLATAEACRRRGRYREAASTARQLAQTSGRVGLEAKYLTAVCAWHMGEADACTQTLEELSRAEGVVALVARSWLATRTQQGDAVELAEEARDQDPNWVPVYLALGRALTHAGNRSEALYHVQQAAVRAPDDPRVFLAFAVALTSGPHGVKDVQEALEHLDRAIELTERRDLELLFMKATLQVERSDFNSALTTFNELLQGNPNHIRGLIYRGLCAETTGDLRQAEDDWRKAYALDPEHVRRAAGLQGMERVARLLNLGGASASGPARLGELSPETEAHLRRRAARIDDDATRTALTEALLLAGRGAATTRIADALAPARGTARDAETLALEELRLWVGRCAIPEALRARERAEMLLPDSPELLLWKAELDLRRGWISTAIRGWDQLVQRFPRTAYAAMAHAQLMLLNFDAERAERAARDACSLDPEHPLAHALHSMALSFLGRHQEALVAFTEAWNLGGASDLRVLEASMMAELMRGVVSNDRSVREREINGALTQFRALTELTPSAYFHADLVRLLIGVRGVEQLAIDVLAAGLQQDPTHPQLLLWDGHLRSARGQAEQAIEAWERARANDPNFEIPEAIARAFRERNGTHPAAEDLFRR